MAGYKLFTGYKLFMGTVRCFEDFKIWQDARLLVNQVYLYTAGVKDYGFND